ncbi:MAG: type II secretion system GspH family protein [Nitrospira sp.]|nr:type II secretion system GspH family protein [Nitrospira sp.]
MRRRDEQGITYLTLMIAIVVIGVNLTVAARYWKMVVQREQEADLLAHGIEIQQALARYSARMKAGRVMPGEVYPQSLAELTRLPKPLLRQVYTDPITQGEWDLLRAPTGGIMGVRSTSKETTIRRHDFPPVVRHFEGRRTYAEWVFQHPNPSVAGLGAGRPNVPGIVGRQSGTNVLPFQNMGVPPRSSTLTPSLP